MALPRIRQLVFASRDQGDIETLREVLGLGAGFVDPGVGEFGLTNGVFALGDQFLEVVVPTQEQTAAGRFMDRSDGIGGYMAIFQTDDLNAVRTRADAQNVRRVWNIDLKDISASHLHPADIGAAIVSIDEARPEGSWRWGGPDWSSNSQPGIITGLEVTASDPAALSAKWAEVLGAPARDLGHDVYELELAGGAITVVPGKRDYLSLYRFTHPDGAACLARAKACGLPTDETSFDFCGVRISLSAN